MKVQINGRYVYETDLPNVEIGDEMILPGTLSPDQMISKPCAQCGEERHYVVEAVNNVGRPTSARSEPCSCGAPINGYGLGSAASFRHFMVDPKL